MFFRSITLAGIFGYGMPVCAIVATKGTSLSLRYTQWIRRSNGQRSMRCWLAEQSLAEILIFQAICAGFGPQVMWCWKDPF